jgi:phosphoribosylglycinamide formyltransferase
MKKIVVFASGSGSNAERIATYFSENGFAKVNLILCNNPQAGVLDRAKRLEIPSLVFDKQAFYKTNIVLDLIKTQQPDLIVLAGFLWKVPENLIAAYPSRILNIHPSLLPKYGGKGMYGAHVHQAVVNNNETESGITIHFVNEHYDEGNILFQAKTKVLPSDTPDTLAEKIHLLEYEHFPKVIENWLKNC